MRARLLVLALMCIFAVGCGGAEEAAPVAETVVGTIEEPAEGEDGGGTETGEDEGEGGEGEEEEPTETTGSGDEEEQEGGDVPSGDPTAGEDVFASSGCGSCHALDAAGASGAVGPNLDDAKPEYERVVEFVTNGKGAMPSFKDQLNDEDIANVAAYVVESTKG